MIRKLVPLAILAGLVIFAFIGNAAEESRPTLNAWDPIGTHALAQPHFTGKITVGKEAVGDSLDIQLGFVPTYFECWVATTDSASAAKHFVWFTGMKNGTALTEGITANDSIVQGGVTPLAGTAADTVVAWNSYVTPPSTGTEVDATGGDVIITGVRLGASILVDSLLFYRAIP